MAIFKMLSQFFIERRNHNFLFFSLLKKHIWQNVNLSLSFMYLRIIIKGTTKSSSNFKPMFYGIDLICLNYIIGKK